MIPRVIDTLQSSVLTFVELRFRSFFTVGVEFWKCSAGGFTFLFIIKIHPNTKPSKPKSIKI